MTTHYDLGDIIILSGSIENPKDNTNFNLFNYRKYLYNNKIHYLFKIDSLLKVESNHNIFFSIKQFIIDRIDKLKYTNKSVKAFAVGDSSLIDDNVKLTYQNNGISHLLALSGGNIALLSLAILTVLKKVKEIPRYIIVILVLILYMFIASNTASIVRATLFFTLLSINKIYYFNIKTINILLLTYTILLIYNAYYLYDVGFVFSFTISFFLIVLSSYIASSNSFLTLLKTSYISFLASFPIVIYNFYQINIMSIIYNMFFVPLVSILIYPLSLLVIIFNFLDFPLYILICIMEKTSIFIDQFELSKIVVCKAPHIIYVMYIILIVYILLSLNKRNYKPVILLIIVVLIHSNYIPKYPSLTMIDVSQGDCFLLRINRTNILIDTGGNLPYIKSKYSTSKMIIIPYLKSIGISHIDYLILTHGDYDHMGDVINLVKNMKVNKICINSNELTDIEQELIRLRPDTIKCTDNIININKYKIELLSFVGNENDSSIVTYLYIYKYKILLMGDASTNMEEKIIDKYNINKIDILKVAHHGSYTGTSETFIKAVKPDIALISVGVNNKFNHPNKEVIARLKQHNVNTYMTSKIGSLRMVFTPKRLKIITLN